MICSLLMMLSTWPLALEQRSTSTSTLLHIAVMFSCLPDTHPEAPAVQHGQVPVQGRRKLIPERSLFLVILLFVPGTWRRARLIGIGCIALINAGHDHCLCKQRGLTSCCC